MDANAATVNRCFRSDDGGGPERCTEAAAHELPAGDLRARSRTAPVFIMLTR